MTPSITESQILNTLRTFLLQVLPSGVEVFKGQANLVPDPMGNDYIVMTPNARNRISTTVVTYDETNPNTTEMDYAESTRIDVQLDFHGETSTDNAQVVQTLFRSPFACDFMANSGVQPLYCDDGAQVPFVNGQNQYEDRWIINAVLQATPVVSTTQQFASSIVVGILDVDVRFPP